MSKDLYYVSDGTPGLCRKRFGRGFRYCRNNGKPIKGKGVLTRIRSLVIPPAWTDVWICPLARGYLQVTGRDARGRKQYLYHTRYRQKQERWKYERMISFAQALPVIRARVSADLARRGLPREKVLAAVVRLLEATSIRVGNDEYARENNSFGLTTMHNRHVRVDGAKMHFEFRGKSGKQHEIDLHDSKLARIVKQCQDLPGQELFVYLDEKEKARDVGSADVNEYIRKISGRDFTAKDFRTWAGTASAAWALARCGPYDTRTAARRNINKAIDEVAERLGNTRAVCRKSYIHPAVIDAYLSNSLTPMLRKHKPGARKKQGKGLSADETAVLGLLQELSAGEKSKKSRTRS
jgi:DNA topoisomerase I